MGLLFDVRLLNQSGVRARGVIRRVDVRNALVLLPQLFRGSGSSSTAAKIRGAATYCAFGIVPGSAAML